MPFSMAGMTPGCVAGALQAWASWYLGYPDSGPKENPRGSHPGPGAVSPLQPSFCPALCCYAHQFRREGQAAQERAEAVIALSSEQGFALWLAWGTIVRGWALAEQGQGEEGIAQMRQGLAAYRPRGQSVAAVFSCPAGRGVWESGAGRRRAERAGRGAGYGG